MRTQQINVDDVIKGVSLDPRIGRASRGRAFARRLLPREGCRLLTRRARDSGRTMLLLESVTKVDTRRQMFPDGFRP